MKRLIIFLIRRHLGLKKFECFQFAGQKSDSVYFFTNTEIMKNEGTKIRPSGVSVNWILNDRCVIRRVDNGCNQKTRKTNA